MENQSQIAHADRPLRVGIDLTALLPVATGVDTYLLQLVEALARVDGETHYTVFVNREDRARFAHRLGENVRLAGWCRRPRPIRLAFQQLLLPAAATLHGLDVVHSPSFIMPMIRGRVRHLLTVYDMTFFSHPECHIPLRRSRPYRAAVLASINRAHLITVPSRSTRAEILRLAPSVNPARLRVVMPGIGEDFRPGTPDGLPLVGKTRIDGLLIASGHYRNGILLAPLTAELIADAVAGRPESRQAQALSPERFEEPRS